MTENYQPKIKLFQVRDFGAKINATFDFLKENFKPLFKIIMVISFPLMAVFAVCYANWFSSSMQMASQGPVETFDESSILTNMALLMIFGTAAMCSFFAIIYRYMKLYQKMAPNDITISVMFKTIFSDSGMILASTIVYGIVVMVGMFLFILPGLYLYIGGSLIFVIVIFENENVISAIGRSLKLIKGNWWSTFGLVFVVALIQSAIAMIFYIPMWVYMAVAAFQAQETGDVFMGDTNNLAFIVMMAFVYAGVFLTYTIGAIAISFQYFNLREKIEAVGLMSDVNSYNKATEE